MHCENLTVEILNNIINIKSKYDVYDALNILSTFNNINTLKTTLKTNNNTIIHISKTTIKQQNKNTHKTQ